VPAVQARIGPVVVGADMGAARLRAVERARRHEACKGIGMLGQGAQRARFADDPGAAPDRLADVALRRLGDRSGRR